MKRRYLVGVETSAFLPDIWDRIFESLEKHGISQTGKVNFFSTTRERPKKKNLSEFIRESQDRPRGFASFDFNNDGFLSISANGDWCAPAERAREKAFDHLGLGIETCTPGNEGELKTSALLEAIAKSTSAVYGRIKLVSNNAAIRHGAREREILLHCLPPLAPVVWLGKQLRNYVPLLNWQRGSYAVKECDSGVLVSRENWWNATTEDLLRSEDQIGSSYFFKDRNWNQYVKSPLTYLSLDLPSLRKPPS